MNFFQIVLSPFVWILMFFYNIFDNYGIALLLFAFLVKLILFPFSIKGKRGMIQTNMIQGKMAKLQKQYGADKNRYNEEVQKLYERENVNPMSGCLWNFIPLLVLLPLYAIVREPLTYMMGINAPQQFAAIASSVNWDGVAQAAGWVKEGAAAGFANVGYNQLYLASLITPQNLAAVQAAVGEGVKLMAINFDFLGLNLALIPTWKFWVNGLDWPTIGLFLMPMVSAASGFFFSLISMKTNAINQQSAAAANNASSKMMLLMSPLMSLWIG
ncbi:MAG: membrane protein insertase YidC, partial [Pseudoflavonifractor sp.]